MSERSSNVETVFCHGTGSEYLVSVDGGDDGGFQAKLELTDTDAGPRPAKFRIVQGSNEELRQPKEFVDIARGAERRRISSQTPPDARKRVREMFEAYQLDAKAVRTCRHCAIAGRYSPITDETAIRYGEEWICPDCASNELERELSYVGGVTAAARQRLEELMLAVNDLDRIVTLLSGELDPELTKFDTISATVDSVDPVSVDSLSLHPSLQAILEERFDTLLPVQSLAVQEDLLEGEDQLVVSATATGKTLIGELAGIDRALRGEGKLLFLVPLVALANQKFDDFTEDYGHLVDVTIRVGGSRISSTSDSFDPDADVIVGTYEGIDHALRTHRDLGDIGTVVIDEVHTLGEGERGHRLDGLIARLHHYCRHRRFERTGYEGAQWIYLSATVGNPDELATSLGARLIEFEERPVPIERHVTFADSLEKVDIENRLVKRAFDAVSSKGYRGQTIIFTNARRRCHEISRRLDSPAAPYHAGLDYTRRKRVERQFADQELAAVVTTAALAAGVDFPASQVIFDSLAMGIEWLTVQEFHQMLGRAGRPDYHDTGTVWMLVEPDGVYHNGMDRTEDEVAFTLLRDEMNPVFTRYDETAAVEETLANVVVAGREAKGLNDRMIGEIPTTHAVGKLLDYGFIDGFEPTPLGRAVTEHFLEPDVAFALLDAIRTGTDPFDIVAMIESREEFSR